MSNVVLTPIHNVESSVVSYNENTTFIIDVPLDEITLSRIQDNLIVESKDNAKVTVKDFYAYFTKNTLPDFVINDQHLSGSDVFSSLDPALAPDEDSQQYSAERRARFHEYTTTELLDGLDRLGGLDLGWPGDSAMATDEKAATAAGEGRSATDTTPPSGRTSSADADVAANTDGDVSNDISHAMTVSGLPAGARLVPGTYNGTYGIITVDDSGNASYKQTALYSHTGAGADTQTGADSVAVDVTLADGSTATMTVSVDIADDVPSISAAIDSGTVEAGASVSGTVNITWGADGPASSDSITVNGVSGTINGEGKLVFALAHGTLTLGEDGSYTFLANPNTDATQELTFKVTDADGDTADTADTSNVISVDISKPDAPEVDSSIEVKEEGLEKGSDAASDSETATWTAPSGYTITDIVHNGEHGTAVITADGTLSYTLDENLLVPGDGKNTVEGADSVTVTLTDANGNTYDVTISVDVVDDVPSISAAIDSGTVDPGSPTSGTVNIAWGPNEFYDLGPDSITIDGVFGGLDNDGRLVFELENGTLTLEQNGSYTFVPNADANPGTGAAQEFTFTILATFPSGDIYEETISVSIAGGGVPAIDSGTVEAGASVSGTVDITWGADGPASSDSITVNNVSGTPGSNGELVFTLEHGTLTLSQDGSYTFTANPNTDATQELTFKVTDADGDTADTADTSNVISVEISKPDTPQFTTDIEVKEEGLANGSDAASDSETATWTAPSGYTITGIVANGEHGTAAIGAGSTTFSYTLGGNLLVPGEGKNTVDNADSVTVTLTDANGNTYDVTVNVDVVDDVPTLALTDAVDTITAGSTHISEAGAFSFVQGADGASLSVSVNGGEAQTVTFNESGIGTVTTDRGTLTLNSADGTYTYEARADLQLGEGGEETFQFTATDADGDTASASLGLTILAGTHFEVGDNTDTTFIGDPTSAVSALIGDTGGTDSTTVATPGQSYNISFILDLSGSMRYSRITGASGGNQADSRIAMAVSSLEYFFQNSIQTHDGDIHIQLVGFGSSVLGQLDLTIAADSTAQERQAAYQQFSTQLETWQSNIFRPGYQQGTNYEAAFNAAAAWYNGASISGNGGTNIAFFMTDGVPTFHGVNTSGGGSYASNTDVLGALNGFANLSAAGDGVQVSSIGIGTSDSLSTQALTILDMLDNTTPTGTLGQTSTYPYQNSGWGTTGKPVRSARLFPWVSPTW